MFSYIAIQYQQKRGHFLRNFKVSKTICKYHQVRPGEGSWREVGKKLFLIEILSCTLRFLSFMNVSPIKNK